MKHSISNKEKRNNQSRIAVIIPCFNEAVTIRKVIRDFKEVLPQADIYVYDNNSTDQTVPISLTAGAIIRHEMRQGKGNVIRRAFREIDADCYILVDGDDTYPAEAAERMVHMVLEEHADMVIGDRLSENYFTQNTRLFHNTGNRVVRFLINGIFKSRIHDIMTGYRAFSRSFVKTLPVLSKGFEIETEMTIHALDKNMNIREITIPYRNRPNGSVSKLDTYSDGFKVLRTIFHLYRQYKPLAFFGVFSGFLLLISFLLFIPVLIAYLDTGMVERFPTLIVSGFLFITSLLSLFSGFILDTINQNSRQMFELFLIQNKPETVSEQKFYFVS